ncbi:macro domain-containing protein [Clostridium botulinum]|uniref:Macro domain-containing protein n=1 Tax=Clostridium botulinum TaxID=1491 RepID=A0A6G4D9E5_CLOBO|nr:macro domain-containing protein [Clostridium botulinum]NFQ98217.1 macro domain-containing protein [Clostridium botulinum]NFU59413.1 macro domain-containing protein [Clostridium botulinum]
MELIEKKMNLFEVDDKYYLAHCISADCTTDSRSMGRGIVVEFNKRFDMKNKIREFYGKTTVKIGDVALIGRVFNLITKGKYYGKPTYLSFSIMLEELKSQVVENNIKYLAIPKIGCGLDRLSWGRVREMIKETFQDVDIKILVCSL